MEKFIIIKDTIKNVRRFNLTGRSLDFKLKPVPPGEEPVSWVRDAIEQVVSRAVDNLLPTDQIGFSICSKDFRRGEGWIPFNSIEKVSFDDVWDVISSIYQSNSCGLDTGSFCLGVTTIRLPTGTGRNPKYNSFAEECNKRRGIIVVKNKDNLCLPRALVVAIALCKKDLELKKVRQDIGKMQTARSIALMKEANVTIPLVGGGIPELQKFQQYLQDFKIVVYRYGSKGREVIFEGSNESKQKLNLLHHETHFNVITSLTAVFGSIYYCEACHIPYDHKNHHRCGGMCPGCYQSPKCAAKEIKIKCDSCKRYFRGRMCYDNHLKLRSWEKTSVCDGITSCEKCFKIVKRNRKHMCGEIFCKNCNTHVPEGHFCYIQHDTGKPKTKDQLFTFYDLETQQDQEMGNGTFVHRPNLCVFSQRCDVCIDETQLYFCQKCGLRVQKLNGPDPVASFTNHLLQMRKKFKNIVVIAHNGQGFDHQFVLNHVLTQTDLTPELIMRGTKIVMMQIGNIKFIDSLNYFPMSLAKLPKAFGLEDNFKKGYFPHLFNTRVNENYVGPLPPMEFYSPDSMKIEDRDTFVSWYEEHKNDLFDMQRDLTDYCVSDVEILTSSCLKFRQQLISTANVCPFTEATTIASTCNKVFRRNFIKPDTIGIIPKNGYRWLNQQSKIAIQWLIWTENQKKINILHAAKGQEAVLHGVKVDGFCAESNEIFEFHGCYYHGCTECYKFGRNDPLFEDPSLTINLRYEATVSKSEKLRRFGFTVHEMWECHFRNQLKHNAAIEAYTKDHPLLVLRQLNPRDAFFGGRTGNVWEYYKAKTDEKICYADVCSLYPSICKYAKFPLGHPEVIVGDECKNLDLGSIEGVIKCTVLPPKKLFHPVLPVKMNNKLMFILCYQCGLQMQSEECNHSDEDRAIEGTWILDELLKALEKGYKILVIHEFWKYKVQQFNKKNCSDGLFTAMMNKFIKIKQEASGWPKDCCTEETKSKYIEEFLEREDVSLEYANITENSGLRSLAKLMLNSFWGKFGQRENQQKTKIVNKPAEFFSMFTNPSICINGVLPINEDTLIVNYEHTEDTYEPLSTVNVVVAAYVTAQARLKLYSYLEQLGKRVLYYDTDSVIYVSLKNESNVETGKFIGDMTDELECYGPNSYITEFVSGGPKNYAFKVFSTNTKDEKVVCKVKGINLNFDASRLVNFNSIRDMVLKKSDPIPIISKNILRTKDHRVTTATQIKVYRTNSTKRKFLTDSSSVPYGYKRQKIN